MKRKYKVTFIIIVCLMLLAIGIIIYPYIYLLQPLPNKIEMKKNNPYITVRLFSGDYRIKISVINGESTKTIFLEDEVKIFIFKDGKKKRLRYPYVFHIEKDFAKTKFYIFISPSEQNNNFYYSIMLQP